jgi:hypothetical protein
MGESARQRGGGEAKRPPSELTSSPDERPQAGPMGESARKRREGSSAFLRVGRGPDPAPPVGEGRRVPPL